MEVATFAWVPWGIQNRISTWTGSEGSTSISTVPLRKRAASKGFQRAGTSEAAAFPGPNWAAPSFRTILTPAFSSSFHPLPTVEPSGRRKSSRWMRVRCHLETRWMAAFTHSRILSTISRSRSEEGL